MRWPGRGRAAGLQAQIDAIRAHTEGQPASALDEARASRAEVATGERNITPAEAGVAATAVTAMSAGGAGATSREKQLRLRIPDLPAGFQPNV